MTQQIINIGLVANDQSGDTIRVAFNKVNANFTDVYSQLGTAIQTLLPSQTGHGGLFLATTGSGLVWAAASGGGGASLPLQTGQAGNYLVTDGVTASWSPITVSVSANGLVGTTLASNVINSSLKTVGTLNSLSVAGNTTIGGNATITGNLNVSGTVTTVNTANLTVTNPLIFTAQGNTGNAVDIGLVGTYNTNKYTGLVKHAADGFWYLFSNDSDAITTTINPASVAKDTLVANLTGNVTGDVSGNATTVSNGVYTYNSYSNPTWITSLSQTKVLPTQGAGTTNYVLTSNGTTASWIAPYSYTLPTAVAGTNLTGTLGGVIPDGTSITITNGVISTGPGTLPSQAGSSGKYLTTDGTTASWANPLGNTVTYLGTNATTNSTVSIYGNATSGTATLTTNVTTGTANVFAGVTGTVTVGASTGTVAIGKLTVIGATTLATSLTGVLKAASGIVSAATAGTDYLTPPSGTSILKAASGGALANAVAGTDYAPGTSLLTTGIVKSTTATGALTIAAGTDISTTFGSQTQNYFYASPNGSSGAPSFRALAFADLPSGVLSVDANGNFTLNNIIVGMTSTVSTGSGTVTLTIASSAIQILTGSLGHNYVLPGTAILSIGHTFYFSNTSSAGSMLIKNAGGTTLATIPYGGNVQFTLLDKGTSNGTWEQHSYIPANSTWGTGALTLGSDLVGTGTTQNVFNTTATTVNFAGAGTIVSIGASTGTTTVNNNLTVTGNLDIKGTTSYIESTTVQVLDKNIEIGKVATPTDTTADGGGITLLGATNKTIIWDQANANWTASENWNIASGKVFKINNTSVLSSTTLGSGVTGSSLTSVGTIGTGVWNGTVVGATYGGTGVNNGSNTLTLAGSVSHAGAYTQTFTATANTSITLPTTGTLATLAGSEALSNKTITSSTYNGLTVTSSTGTLTIAALKTFVVNNSITLAGTDSTTITLPATTGTVALNNQAFYLGTTSVSINRTSANLALTGITSIDGYAAGIAGGAIGYIPYQSAANTTLFVTGNTTTTPQFLTSTGTGSAAQAPTLTGSTGTGNVVLATSPTLVTPTLGVASATSINGVTITSSTGTFTLSNLKTFAVQNTITLAGTDSTTITLPATTGTVALNNQTFFIGSTSIAINRATASLSLTGITSIDGYAAGLAGGNNTTLLGSLPYQSNTNTTSLLSPNTSATKNFLVMTGTGTNGAAPSWGTLATADVPAHYIGTTSITFSRASASQSLTGVSIDGTAGKATNLVGGNNTTLLGSIGYQSNTDTTTLLSPNTTATKKFLRQTGDGTNGAAPAWDTLVAGDIPSLSSAQLATILSDETGTGVVVFGTSPAITTSITTASTSFDLLNTTATTLNIGGAATTVSIGATTGTASINNATVTLGNATALNVNGVSPTLASTSTGTLTLFNTNLLTVNAFNAATTATLVNSATTLGIGNTATAAQTVNMFTASTGASTYNIATGATASATTKAINIGTAGVSGSTTNIAIGSTVSGATSTLTFGGTVADATATSTAKSVGYIGMPQQSKSSAYTTVIGDAGKHIYVTATATITIDSNANVAYPIGTTIAFIAASGATVTIAITSDTMYLGGTGTTGSRTLAAYGMATAVKVTATSWFINGTGLT